MKSNLPSDVSLRDYMAAHALIGILANPDITKMITEVSEETELKASVPGLAATMAYQAAKSMMLARDL